MRGQGRPLGLLAAWLRSACRTDCESRAEHMAYKPSLQERKDARIAVKELEGAERFLEFERAREEGEPSEPEAIA